MKTLTAVLFVLGLCSAQGFAQDDNSEMTKIKEQELEEVRERISELKQSMDRRAAERDRITGELQAAEVIISEKRLHLQELEKQRRYSEKKKADLDQRLKAREAELETETTLLEDQVFAAYSTGGQERLKLLLNQLDPAALGRQLAYYRYFSEYRGRNIEAVNTHISELRQLRAQVAEEENRLAALTRERFVELTELGAAQEKRQQLLASLKSRIAEEGSEIQRLAAQEQDLSRLIAELGSILADYPIRSEEPFSELKGRLTWPVAGGLVHDFGQPRAGGLKWNGVVLTAPRGREVRSVYHGRVVFADWLSGLGLLVIV
ncbi:MAG TPA: hypothetical protein VLB07_12405, partial [Woeseiaceae bacterium]|nr:hypothetical protein [Woeseiaceae bacterium]